MGVSVSLGVSFAPRPLTLMIIPQPHRKVNRKMQKSCCASCTNSGNRSAASLCNLPIDFLCGAWYNGNSGLRLRLRPAELVTTNSSEKERGGVAPTYLQLCEHLFKCFFVSTEFKLNNDFFNLPISFGS